MSHSYYVVSKGSGLIVNDGPNKTRAYKTFGAAMATRTRLCRKSGWNISELSYHSYQKLQTQNGYPYKSYDW
jgi:hypothetical protein